MQKLMVMKNLENKKRISFERRKKKKIYSESNTIFGYRTCFRQAFLNRAAEEAAQRGLRVRGALEAMPSNIQNIMLSKQAQAATAASAEAERAKAAADQQDAATQICRSWHATSIWLI